MKRKNVYRNKNISKEKIFEIYTQFADNKTSDNKQFKIKTPHKIPPLTTANNTLKLYACQERH